MGSKTEGGALILGTRGCCIIDKPVDLAWLNRFNTRARQSFLRSVKNGVKRVDFASTSGHEYDFGSMVDDWECEGDASRRWLGRIFDISHPSIRFCQEFVTRKEGSSVTIGTHAKHDDVEDGESGRVLLGEFFDELLFVLVG